MTETPKIDLFDTTTISGFFKSLGIDDIFPKPSTESEDAPEVKKTEERTYPLDEAVRVLRKIEENAGADPYLTQTDLIAVADRYIKLAEITLQYEVDN